MECVRKMNRLRSALKSFEGSDHLISLLEAQAEDKAAQLADAFFHVLEEARKRIHFVIICVSCLTPLFLAESRDHSVPPNGTLSPLDASTLVARIHSTLWTAPR